MAEHAPAGNNSHGMYEHRRTYQGFLKASIALVLISFYVLVALVSFRFADTLNVLIGFVGLALGILAVMIDARAGSRWYLSLGLLAVFALITAINVA
jgi:hypothetical protein